MSNLYTRLLGAITTAMELLYVIARANILVKHMQVYVMLALKRTEL